MKVYTVVAAGFLLISSAVFAGSFNKVYSLRGFAYKGHHNPTDSLGEGWVMRLKVSESQKKPYRLFPRVDVPSTNISGPISAGEKLRSFELLGTKIYLWDYVEVTGLVTNGPMEDDIVGVTRVEVISRAPRIRCESPVDSENKKFVVYFFGSSHVDDITNPSHFFRVDRCSADSGNCRDIWAGVDIFNESRGSLDPISLKGQTKSTPRGLSYFLPKKYKGNYPTSYFDAEFSMELRSDLNQSELPQGEIPKHPNAEIVWDYDAPGTPMRESGIIPLKCMTWE